MLKFKGIANETAEFFEKEQLSDVVLWKKFVDQFRIQEDGDNKGWRGEYWGKMMRGGALVCGYTKSEALYAVLTDAVKDMLTVAEADGRVSSYKRDCEFGGWDMWCRKYVILGCEYYLEICKDEAFKARIIDFLRAQTDYIIAHIGEGEGKKPITRATKSWLGINSSSILEPIVRLYNLTGDKKYLDFASYIVRSGGGDGVDIFEAAYRNELAPYQYGVSKAYELTSCLEGLLEYYLATGVEKYRVAVINYAKAVLNTEISIIGSCGVTHELFDHTRTRQTSFYDGVVQETCVTVTWMKFCSRVLELTGDSAFADAMEHSFYNAYLGALNVDRKVCKPHSSRYNDDDIIATFLPVDSYSPLVPDRRGKKVGGGQILSDRTFYGCCACISAAGVGVFLKSAVVADGDTVTVNFFETGEADFEINGVPVKLCIETAYPVEGGVVIRVKTAKPVQFTLKVRNPGWADGAGGYAIYDREWSDDTVAFELAMPFRIHLPEHWDTDVIYTADDFTDWGCHYTKPIKVTHKPEEDRYFAVTRGPVTLAADSRTGKPADSAFQPTCCATRRENEITDGAPCLEKFEFLTDSGESYCLVDYASAGRDWETLIAAWLPTENKNGV